MKILHAVEYYHPSVGGAQEVIRQLSEHLVALGHEVVVATTKLPNRRSNMHHGVRIREFDVAGNAVIGYRGKDVKKYQNFLLANDFDVIATYAAQQWTTDLLLEVIAQLKTKKIFFPCGFSGLNHPDFQSYYQRLLTKVKNFDKVLCTSKEYQDYVYLTKHGVRAQILPNGASEIEFKQKKSQPNLSPAPFFAQTPFILNVSSHVSSKGHADLIKIFARLKKTNLNLLMISNTLGHHECAFECAVSARKFNRSILRYFDKKKIILADLNRQETVYAFQTAQAFLFPSKIECAPLVLYEATAAGLPFVSYPSGNAREIARRSQGGLIATDISDAAKLLKKILDNPALSRRLSQHGRKYWENYARWDKITLKYAKICASIISPRQTLR